MITNGYVIRKTNDIRNENDVINFPYIKGVSERYSAISFEKKYNDRDSGYHNLMIDILKSLDFDERKQSLYYYSEFIGLVDDNRINRYKGYWGLKPYKYTNYDFLKDKTEVVSGDSGSLKMRGIAKVDSKELPLLIKNTSYSDMSFYFLVSNNYFDREKFIIFMKNNDFSQCINYLLKVNGFIFIFLGDEKVKTSEIVFISKEIFVLKLENNMKF